jgi:hypothetical protein
VLIHVGGGAPFLSRDAVITPLRTPSEAVQPNPLA